MIALPSGYSFQSQPAFIRGEDCMGCPYQHWTQVAMTPHVTRKLILAYADSEIEVSKKLVDMCWEDHTFRNLPDQERLDKMVAAAQKQGRFYDADLVDVIAILAKRMQ